MDRDLSDLRSKAPLIIQNAWEFHSRKNLLADGGEAILDEIRQLNT